MFMQMPLPAPHGSASHSFTSGKDAQAARRQRDIRTRGRPRASRPPARRPPLTHAVAVLRVRPVARIAMARVVRGARDALAVATDVLVQSALVCLWWGRGGEEGSTGTEPRALTALTSCHVPQADFHTPFLITQIPEPGHTMPSGT